MTRKGTSSTKYCPNLARDKMRPKMYHNKMTTIGERIKKRRGELGLSQSALAILCGWTDSHTRIAKYEKNDRQLSSQYAEILAKALKTTPEWLMFGREPQEPKSTKGAPTLPSGAIPIQSYLPILAWNEVPLWLIIADNKLTRGEFMKKKQENHEIIEIFHHFVSEKAFSLRVKNNSMTSSSGGTSLQEGDFVYIEPKEEVLTGKLVVVSIPGIEEMILRKYILEGGKQLLIPLNPQYPSTEMTPDMEILGVAVCKYSYSKL